MDEKELEKRLQEAVRLRKKQRPKRVNRAGREPRGGTSGGTCPLCGETYEIHLPEHLRSECCETE